MLAPTVATPDPMDPERRLELTVTSGAEGVGLAAIAVPFVSSLGPSERARALGGTEEVTLRAIQPGDGPWNGVASWCSFSSARKT